MAIEGLIFALQVVNWEFCQTTIPDNKPLVQIRSGILALGNALEAEVVGDVA